MAVRAGTLLATTSMLAIAALLAPSAGAQTFQWIGPASDSNWSSADNWENTATGDPGPPTAGSHVRATDETAPSTATGTGPITFDAGADTGTGLGSLLISGFGNITANMALDHAGSGTLTVGTAGDEGSFPDVPGTPGVPGNLYVGGVDSIVSGVNLGVGNPGQGTLNITGDGQVIVNGDMLLGSGTGSVGTVNQTGFGSVVQVNPVIVGFDVDGFPFTERGTLVVGDGGTGTYNLDAGGNSEVPGGSLTTGLTYVGGFDSTGIFNHTSGAHTANNLNIGLLIGGSGTYNLTGGDVFAGTLAVGGQNSTGTVNHTSGNLSAGAAFISGVGPTGTGTYNLGGGNVLVFGDTFVGQSGTGTVNQTDGSFATSGLYLGGDINGTGTGTYNLSGGLLTTDFASLGNAPAALGTINQTGGTHNANTIVIGNLGSGYDPDNQPSGNAAGVYNLGGGAGAAILNATSVSVGGFGNGVFNLSTNGGATIGSLLVGDGPTVPAGGDPNPRQGTVNMTGGTLDTGSVAVGAQGIGAFNQSGGAHTVTNTLTVGRDVDSMGSYTLSGDGSLSTAGQTIGGQGQGTFLQTGGSNTVRTGDLTIGSAAVGSYELQSGSLNVNGNFQLLQGNINIGQNATGSMLQNGGTVFVNSGVFVGAGATGIGSYTLNDGSLTALGSFFASFGPSLSVGSIGQGTFTQNGGSVDTFGFRGVVVGDAAGSTGSYVLNSGALHSNNGVSSGNQIVGDSGIGSFTQNGGGNTVDGTLWIGKSAGSSGTYDLNGGTLAVGGNVEIGAGAGGGSGVLRVQGGSLSAANVNNTAGNTLAYTAGSFAANLQNAGTATVAGNAPLTVTGNVTNSGMLNIGSGATSTVATVTGTTGNTGTVKVTNATVDWQGTFNNSGAYISDPSINNFGTLQIAPSGYLQAGAGDQLTSGAISRIRARRTRCGTPCAPAWASSATPCTSCGLPASTWGAAPADWSTTSPGIRSSSARGKASGFSTCPAPRTTARSTPASSTSSSSSI